MKRMDEMELHIQLSAMRWAWLADFLVLAVWGIWGTVQTGRMTAPMYLLILQNPVFFAGVQIGKLRVGDPEGRRSLIAAAVMVVVLVVLGMVLLGLTGV